MRRANRVYAFVVLFAIALFLSACQAPEVPTENAAPAEVEAAPTEVAAAPTETAAPPTETAPPPTETAVPPTETVAAPAEETDAGDAEAAPAPEARTLEEKIANAMSAGPAAIAQDAAILDYPEEWPGGWPDEPAPAFVEIREGTNGWTCIVDIPDTPGNDPMCLNETYLQDVLLTQRGKVDAPSTGVGFGYMLQGGGPVGSPPHMMVFVPESNDSFDAFDTEPGPFPWIMFPDTTYQHLMVLLPPPVEAVSAEEDKIANAMSAGPAAIAQDATILDYPEEWPGGWPDEPAPELVEIRAGTNGWTCIVDIPDTPGNDPMCLNDTYLQDVLVTQRSQVEAPATGIGFGYMLQGGGPIGSPPHMMVFAPESNGSFDAFGTEPGPFPWIMFPETSYQHLMVLAE